ncbi:DUF359 domain-containing protein [Halobacteriales archaeon QS_8_69_26]|nr:MAG: DUF359 domain-containing protein [Halobacteriales archaeon QS_8_69_26]
MSDDGPGDGNREGSDPPSPDNPEVLLRLPESARDEFKDPLGPVFTDADALLSEAGDPLVAVGDVVTYHLLEAGRRPDLAVVDGITQRGPVEDAIRERVVEGDGKVPNPAATLSADLLRAIRRGLDADDPATVVVDGEEDLATLPAVLALPEGASVVYGQPGEGMVLVTVSPETRERAEALFRTLDGDHDRARELLGIGGL